MIAMIEEPNKFYGGKRAENAVKYSCKKQSDYRRYAWVFKRRASCDQGRQAITHASMNGMRDMEAMGLQVRGNTMASKIVVGDRVQYSKSFLRSTGQFTGDVPHAKGTVSDIKTVGKKSLVTVDWGNENVPPRVLADNLSKLK